MSVQMMITVALIAAAAVYVLAGLRRAWSGRGGGCGSGCGKCADPAEEPKGSRIPLRQVGGRGP